MLHVAESWFELSREDQSEALEVAAARSGRPAHLLEKDVWVVWALGALYSSPLAQTLTFKGGTSLSKVYGVIQRFSEDIDLTLDIRELVSDLLRDQNPIPASASAEKKITSAVRNRLPAWIETKVKPILQAALLASGLHAELVVAGVQSEKLLLSYPAIKIGTGYSAPHIQLEFGGRSTGEPHQIHAVACDMAAVIEGVAFPVAKPVVMALERTFWEKATAIHVYCLQGKWRSQRYSRHWYDLVAIAQSSYFESALKDIDLAQQVAQHKAIFFAEKNAAGNKIDYFRAVNGAMQLVPKGDLLTALKHDYTAMLNDGLLALDQPTFAELMECCQVIEARVNAINAQA
jgi:hypothetical protein